MKIVQTKQIVDPVTGISFDLTEFTSVNEQFIFEVVGPCMTISGRYLTKEAMDCIVQNGPDHPRSRKLLRVAKYKLRHGKPSIRLMPDRSSQQLRKKLKALQAQR